MPPPKRIRKSVERFDPHPPGSSHQMGADRVRKTRGKQSERERKRKERRADSNENTGKDLSTGEKDEPSQDISENNNLQAEETLNATNISTPNNAEK